MKKVILFLIFSIYIFAVTLSPLTQTLDSKKKKHLIFTVHNPTKEPVAVNFEILRLLDTDNNKEKREKTDKVTYYPSQFVLGATESKKVRIRYMGSTLPDIEEVYRVIAQELDIDVSDKKDEESISKVKASIKMRFSYAGLLFVHQPNAIENLKVDSFEVSPNREITIHLNNSGTMSIVPNASHYNYIVKVNGKDYKLLEEDLKGAEFRRVLPNKTNTFYLKNIINLPNGKIESIRIERI
jgi:P pilus assembly chaperone PapD